MNNFFTELGYKAVQFVQYLFIPGFFLLFTVGVVLFLIARKNPTRRRKGYLYTIFGGIGILFITYGPVLFLYYSSVNPIDTQGFLNTEIPIAAKIYAVFMAVVEPILLYLTYFGVGYLLMAAREPFRKRMGTMLLVGAPVVWLILYYTPSMFPSLNLT